MLLKTAPANRRSREGHNYGKKLKIEDSVWEGKSNCPGKQIGNFLNQKNDVKNFLHKSCTKSDKNLALNPALNLALNLTKILHSKF